MAKTPGKMRFSGAIRRRKRERFDRKRPQVLFIAFAAGSFLLGGALGQGRHRGKAHEMEFAALEQFPLDFVPGLQTDGGGQGQGKAHVEPGLLPARTDGLDFEGIGDGHFFRWG